MATLLAILGTAWLMVSRVEYPKPRGRLAVAMLAWIVLGDGPAGGLGVRRPGRPAAPPDRLRAAARHGRGDPAVRHGPPGEQLPRQPARGAGGRSCRSGRRDRTCRRAPNRTVRGPRACVHAGTVAVSGARRVPPPPTSDDAPASRTTFMPPVTLLSGWRITLSLDDGALRVGEVLRRCRSRRRTTSIVNRALSTPSRVRSLVAQAFFSASPKTPTRPSSRRPRRCRGASPRVRGLVVGDQLLRLRGVRADGQRGRGARSSSSSGPGPPGWPGAAARRPSCCR